MGSFRISPSMAVVAVLIILTLLGAWRYDGFLGTYNVQTVLRYNSMFALVALGMCFVIMTGGIDLSVGSVAALSSVVAAHLSHYGLFPGLAGGLCAGPLRGDTQCADHHATEDHALHRDLGDDARGFRNRLAAGKQSVRFRVLRYLLHQSWAG